MPSKTNGQPVIRKPRGFAAMSKEQQLAICCLGGKSTVRRHGKKYMRKLGKHGREVRTKLEKFLKKQTARLTAAALKSP